jgi:hypothetical protein
VVVDIEALTRDVPSDNTVVLMREPRPGSEAHDDDQSRGTAPVVALFGNDDEDEGEVGPADDGPKASVDDLFARLRAARADAVAERAKQPDEPEPSPVAEVQPSEDLTVFQPSPAAPVVEEALDDSPFGRRDASLTPIIVACARKLKRVLADEQNEILHTLRRAEPVQSLQTMLPSLAEQASRYGDAIRVELEKAAMVGAAGIDEGTAKDHKAEIKRADALKPALEALTTSIVEPLRQRLDRALSESDGDNGELASAVRSIYREWKTQRIDEHLDDVTRIAFGRGAFAAVVPGTKVCWLVDPNGPACPDAEDNALAGEVAAGEQFPTGHECAPAHAGCRCMLALAPR